MTRRAGFMLLEMLVALILLTAFALIASRLFSWSLRVVREAPLAQEQIMQLDSMLEALRGDAWSSAAVEVPDSQTLRLNRPNQPPVRWDVGAGGRIVRSTGAEADRRAWMLVGAPVRFAQHEAGLELRLMDRTGAEDQRILLPSQLLVLGKQRDEN